MRIAFGSSDLRHVPTEISVVCVSSQHTLANSAPPAASPQPDASAVVVSWAAPEPIEPPPAAPVAEVSREPVAERSLEPTGWATYWLTDRDIAVFTLLAAVVLSLLVVRWGQLSGWGTAEIEIERLQPLELDYRLDPNTATWVELAELDRIGESLALRIVADRETHGPFHSVDDLDRVKGIGPKTLDRLRPYLEIRQPSP